MANKRATLTLRFGDNEVLYEAEREAVEAQLEHVLDRLLPGAGTEVRVGLDGAKPRVMEASGASPAAPVAPDAEAVPEPERLARLYAVGKGGRLRLRKLPKRTADALLLVLYGMRKLQDRTWVHAPGMTSAARASGARFERADRLLAAYQDLVEGFGNRRAKRYRLTAAGREHCARLVRELVGEAAPARSKPPPAAVPGPVAEPAPAAAVEDGIPAKVTSRWQGELLTAAEVARHLDVGEALVGKLRFAFVLFGLPGGDRRKRRYFYPAFQIDVARHRVHPQVRQTNRLAGRAYTSWPLAKWWSTVEESLGRIPMEFIGTHEADEVVRVATESFGHMHPLPPAPKGVK